MSLGIIWHQTDLRTDWNPALSAAAQKHELILPVYLYDSQLENLGAASKWWLHHSLEDLAQQYERLGCYLLFR